MVALKRTSSRCPIPTPLHQPALHYLSEGPIGSADLRKDVQQLKLPVRRVEVEQRDDEDGRQILPPTILREQQRSTYTTCVEVAGRTLLRAQEARRRERCRRKPPENSPASRPRSTSKASMASTKLVRAPRQSPLQPHPYCAAAVARPSGAIGGPDRDQPRLLCPPTRAARAALRGRTIIWHRQTTVRPRPRERLIYFHGRQEGPSLKIKGQLTFNL